MLCLESRVREKGERKIQSEWGMGKRSNRRQLFDAGASTLNSLSSRQCRSAGDAQSLLLTARLRAAPTPCLTLDGSSIYHNMPNRPNKVLCTPEFKKKIDKLPCHFTMTKKWAILQTAEAHAATLCELSAPNHALALFEGRTVPLKLEGFVMIPNPLYLMNPPATEI